MADVQVTIKNVDADAFSELKAEAVKRKLPVGKALSLAIENWLAESRKLSLPLTKWKTVKGGPNTRLLSKQIELYPLWVSIVAIFLDVSYLLALYNENDVHHKRARLIAEKIDANEYGRALISDDIFDEVISVALRKLGKEKSRIFGRQILSSILIVHGDKHLFDSAFKIFNASEYNFSFTDCMGQAIMDLAQIRYIATFDKMFEKLDFKIVS